MSNSKQLNKYIDATFLATSKQLNCSKDDIIKKNVEFVNEVLPYHVKALMIRPNMLKYIKPILIETQSKTLLGTVIDFPKGNKGLEYKLKKAKKAIEEGADELDFVCNYKEFQYNKSIEFIKEIIECTKFVLEHKKTIKWIIETAALSSKEIVQITALIKNTLVPIIKENQFEFIFVKSSTGYFKTKNNLPNGATRESITLMIENASPIQVKASGGIKNQEDAINYIKMGVSRIGTSATTSILNNQNNSTYNY
jgi:deoxyribose-phosphate aldolase